MLKTVDSKNLFLCRNPNLASTSITLCLDVEKLAWSWGIWNWDQIPPFGLARKFWRGKLDQFCVQPVIVVGSGENFPRLNPRKGTEFLFPRSLALPAPPLSPVQLPPVPPLRAPSRPSQSPDLPSSPAPSCAAPPLALPLPNPDLPLLCVAPPFLRLCAPPHGSCSTVDCVVAGQSDGSMAALNDNSGSGCGGA